MLAWQAYGGADGRPPLVMIHGFLCGGLFFRPTVAALSYPLVTIDLPGFGDSGAVAAVDSIAAMARQVRETLAAAGYRRYHVLGHSMGGMVALQLALTAAAQVDSLLVYASNSSGDLPERFESFAASKRRLREDFAAAKHHICATWFTAGARHRHFGLVEQCSASVQLAAAEKALDAMAAFDVSAMLATITMPVLIISAELDRTYSLARQQRLCAALPRARQHIIKGCAHCAHLENESEFNQVVMDWLVSPRA